MVSSIANTTNILQLILGLLRDRNLGESKPKKASSMNIMDVVYKISYQILEFNAWKIKGVMMEGKHPCS